MVSGAASTRTAMGFGSGEAWGQWTSSCTFGSGAGGCGSWVDSHWHGVGIICGQGRIAFSLTGSESDVRHWKVWFREPRRLALLWGLGVESVRPVDFQLYVRLRSGRLRQLGRLALAWSWKKKVACGQGRIAFSLTGSESEVRHWKVWFREPHCYGVWEWQSVRPVDFQLYLRLQSGRLRQLGRLALAWG